MTLSKSSILVLLLAGVDGLLFGQLGCGSGQSGEEAEERGVCNVGAVCSGPNDCAEQCEGCSAVGAGTCFD